MSGEIGFKEPYSPAVCVLRVVKCFDVVGDKVVGCFRWESGEVREKVDGRGSIFGASGFDVWYDLSLARGCKRGIGSCCI